MDQVTRRTEPLDYVPESDREKPLEEQTVITLRPMTQAEHMRTFDEEDELVIKGSEQMLRSKRWELHRRIARDHIVAVKNYPVGAAKPWPASGSRAEKEAYLATMPSAAVFLIGMAVRDSAEQLSESSAGAER